MGTDLVAGLRTERYDKCFFFFVENVPFRIRLKSMGKGIIQIIKAEINRIVGFSEER